MKKTENNKSDQNKTGKESNQKTNEDFNKKETNPNNPNAKKDYKEVSTPVSKKSADSASLDGKQKNKN
jgi:hypothetical protein